MFRVLYQRLIAPIISSVAPLPEVSLGVAMGLFVGLTPTMGVQMYIVFGFWLLCRKVSFLRFNLPISVALVWITNPLTVIPIYYLFLITGNHILPYLEIPVVPMNYEQFQHKLTLLMSQDDVWHVIIEGTRFLVIDLGTPVIIGSLCYAVPLSIGSYFLTWYGMWHYRCFKARRENLTYPEWRLRYEKGL